MWCRGEFCVAESPLHPASQEEGASLPLRANETALTHSRPAAGQRRGGPPNPP
jgi:hypothetical protein